MLTLTNLSSPKGAHRDTKRLGRGQGSGQGTQAGRGNKGQKARSGGGTRPGFQGGSMPLYMRIPKRGFKNAPFKEVCAEISLAQLDSNFDGGEVTRAALIEKGLLKGINKRRPIKILANGELKKSLNLVDIDKASKKAAEMIGKAGGTINIKEKVNNSKKSKKKARK